MIETKKEKDRLKALQRYHILDTPPESSFDRITLLASQLLNVPVAITSLVDKNRVWFKSRHGVDFEEVKREPGLCASAILQNKPYILNDASIDPRSHANSLVSRENGFRFYVGVPLITHDQHNLGTLFVMDYHPRSITHEELNILIVLAQIVMDEMELRRKIFMERSPQISMQNRSVRMESEDNYKIMVELSPEPIVVHVEGRIVFINRAGAELFASTPKRLIGKPIIEFVHPDYVDLAKSRIEQILIKRKQTELIEQKFVALDGKIINVEVRAKPIIYHGKRAALLLFRDITVKKQLEQVIRESDTRYHQIILNSPQPIVIHSDGICVFINIEAAKLFGFSKQEEAVGQNIYDFIHPNCRAEAKARIQEASLGNHIGFTEHKMVRLDGQLIDVEISSLSVDTYLGKPVIQSVLSDVTERKRTEDLLRTSEKLAVLGQLAAGIAHEIRNPLTALKGFVQLLKSKNHENNKYYDIMHSEIERINLIVSEFMFLARPAPDNFQQSNVCSLVRHTITLLESQALLTNVQIQTNFESETVWIKCIENQIKQVFLNLMKNAIEAMPEGGNVIVEITVPIDVKLVTIRFTDRGRGIAPDYIAKLGEPFYTTKETGTGLGLMVSYNIIISHKGGINISSELGKGTIVEVVLPLLETENEI
jgi:two-component system, sporulation sensor kinase A